MSKHRKDPLLEALNEGKSYTWTVPDGGNLASMRKAIKHGQTLTMSPIADPKEIQVGDFVLVRWHQGDIFHIVGTFKVTSSISENCVSFTYGDSFPAMNYNDGKPYSGQVYTRNELTQVIERYGLPQDRNRMEKAAPGVTLGHRFGMMPH